jgi:hypothetical protein
MSRVCGTHGRDEKWIRILFGEAEWKRSHERQDADERIILEWILE